MGYALFICNKWPSNYSLIFKGGIILSHKIFDAILNQAVTKVKMEKHQKIVETAIQLFVEKGYANNHDD